jgi:hypothetical protein
MCGEVGHDRPSDHFVLVTISRSVRFAGWFLHVEPGGQASIPPSPCIYQLSATPSRTSGESREAWLPDYVPHRFATHKVRPIRAPVPVRRIRTCVCDDIDVLFAQRGEGRLGVDEERLNLLRHALGLGAGAELRQRHADQIACYPMKPPASEKMRGLTLVGRLT